MKATITNAVILIRTYVVYNNKMLLINVNNVSFYYNV